jgi:RNA polymerase sigma factor (TIGR02999 family)
LAAIESSADISDLITAWGEGNTEALNRLMPLVYPELRRIARQLLGRPPRAQTLESAALANEAFLKLTRAGGIRCESRVHFLALCSQIIRRIVVDHARSHRYAKRGGAGARMPLDEGIAERIAAPAPAQINVLAMDRALESLSKFDPRKARVVELRYFGGLSVEETAEALAISPETAKRDWKAAKAWLFRELSARSAR